jgi:uncharacterized membrane protein YwzB
MSWEYQVSSESQVKPVSYGYSRVVLLFVAILLTFAVGGFFGA